MCSVFDLDRISDDTLRDLFAKSAMQTLLDATLRGDVDSDGDNTFYWVAKDAYKVADAMLNARKQYKSKEE